MDEELNKILTNEDLSTEEKKTEINKLVGNNFVPTKKYADLKASTNEKYDTLKNEYEDFKKSKMTDEEKAQEEAKEKEEELTKYRKEISRLNAISVFKGEGLNENDYNSLLGYAETLNPEDSKNFASTIVGMIKTQKEDYGAKVKDDIIKGTPKPTAGSNGDAQNDKLTEARNKLANARKNGNSAEVVRYLTEYQNLLQNQK